MTRVINFQSIFTTNGQSDLILILILESKGPYYHYYFSHFTKFLKGKGLDAQASHPRRLSQFL